MTVVLAAIAALALAVANWFIWVHAPLEETMGLVQKIFYIHLPMAWWGMISFLAVFVGSVMVLWKKSAFWDRLAGASCEVGVLFSGLALVTGSLWGKPIWNVWWTWDPRLTTTLIMWFVYCAYLLLRQAGVGGERGAVVRAALGVVAFLDVPLVFISARKWRSIHPTVFGQQGGGLEPEMFTAVLVSIAAVGIFWVALVRLRTLQLGQDAAVRQAFLHRTR
uniref:Heme exporter protein C n=1 Tax=Fundidesulfovibrio putealis TaxID=270496 RepID=A0A7C4AI72_9BACT